MPLTLTWHEIALRLALSVVAGTLIGLDRGEHGRPAGLRTTLLVCLAAAVAMIQANLLLATTGKTSDSFITLDLMRLPLGILTGMGFIGAGAVLRRDRLVFGVTTAATIWFRTVIGLCFGGGQIALGLAGVALGMFVLAGLKFIEDRMKQDHQAKLLIVTGVAGPSEDEIHAILQNGGFRISSCAFAATQGTDSYELSWDLHWRARPYVTTIPEAVHTLTAHQGIVRVAWT